MDDQSDPALALRNVRDAVVGAGFDLRLNELSQRIWRSNLDRLEPDLGDTARLLGMNCAENMTQLLHAGLIAPGTRIAGVRATLTKGALLIEMAGSRFRVVKAPFRSGLTPDWRHDFRWTPDRPLRYEMADSNNRAYPLPLELAEVDPLMSAEDVGVVRNAQDLHDFFFVWAGVPGPPPRTAGWIVAPTTAAAHVLAIERLWVDDVDDPGQPSDVPIRPGPGPEPELKLTVRRRRGADVA